MVQRLAGIQLILRELSEAIQTLKLNGLKQVSNTAVQTDPEVCCIRILDDFLNVDVTFLNCPLINLLYIINQHVKPYNSG